MFTELMPIGNGWFITRSAVGRAARASVHELR
jgi:hypothetical protein